MFNKASEFPKNHVTITPSDSASLNRPMVIYCGADGNISVTDVHGTTVVYAMVKGQLVPVLAEKINATGTTSAQVIGLY